VASRAWTDFDEDVVVDVLLRNSTEAPVYLSGIFAVLLDSAGEHVIGEQGYVFDGLVMGGLGRMFPGELVPASIRINMDPEAPLEWDHYEVRLLDAQEYPISPDEYTADFETSVTTVANYGSGIVGLSGAVVNNGSQAVEMVFLRAVLYDEEDDFLGAAEGMVWSLAAGASAPFSLDGIVDPGSEIGRYEVTAVARLGTP
jgi:hypothetical protein